MCIAGDHGSTTVECQCITGDTQMVQFSSAWHRWKKTKKKWWQFQQILLKVRWQLALKGLMVRTVITIKMPHFHLTDATE